MSSAISMRRSTICAALVKLDQLFGIAFVRASQTQRHSTATATPEGSQDASARGGRLPGQGPAVFDL
jgi:hypothetical protein